MFQSNRAWFHMAVCAIALAISGCGPSSTSERSLEEKGGSNGRTPSGDDDQSLTTAEYIALGVPAPDRVWGGAAMQVAAAMLQKLSQTNPERLPRLGSARSGVMFDQISSAKNFDYYDIATLPLDVRIPDSFQMLQACNSIADLYRADVEQRNQGAREYVELLGMQFQANVAALQMVKTVLATLSPQNKSYAPRAEAFAKIQQECSALIAGAVTILSQRDTYSAESLKRLLAIMAENCGKLLPLLPEETRAETLTRLTELREESRSGDLEPELSALVEIIENTTDSP